MRGEPSLDARSTAVYSQGSAGDALTSTIAAVADHVHVLEWVVFGYSAINTGLETFTIEINDAVKYKWYFPVPVTDELTAVSMNHIVFPRGFYGAVNQKVELILSAPAGAILASISYGYH